MLKEKTARDRLIEANIGLVHACAGRLKGRGVEYEDLVQAGCVGLCKAADGFDASRGFAFSTYAVPTILGEMRRLFRDGGAVKVGRSVKEQSRRLRQTQDALAAKLGREPLLSELAAEAGLDVREAAFLLNAAFPTVSLTDAQDEHAPQLDVPVPPPDSGIEDRVSLYASIAQLDEREQTIVRLRYFGGLTQTKVAERLGVSQVQVSRKEKAILRKLREQFAE